MDKKIVEEAKKSIIEAGTILNPQPSKVNKDWLKIETDKFDLMRSQLRGLIIDYPTHTVENKQYVKNTLTIWLGYYEEVLAEAKKAIGELK